MTRAAISHTRITDWVHNQEHLWDVCLFKCLSFYVYKYMYKYYIYIYIYYSPQNGSVTGGFEIFQLNITCRYEETLYGYCII